MKSSSSRLFPHPCTHNWYILSRIREEVSHFVSDHLAAFSHLPKVLDFGAGDAPYLPLFDGKVAEYVCCDIPQNRKADIHILEDGSVPLPDRSFDVILSIQVLEHVDDVSTYLAETSRLLKDDGVVFLSTHGQWIYHPFPRDLWRWTIEGLQEVVSHAGFDVVKIAWCGGPLVYALQLITFTLKWSMGERLPLLASLFPICSLILNRCMPLADRITSVHGSQNAALYFLVLKKFVVHEKGDQK